MNEKKLEERKKMIYGLLCDELYVPMRTKEIAMLLDIPKSKRQDLQEVLDALVEEGKAQVSKKGKYQKAEKVVKEGAFISHAKGFGFVCVDDEGEDYYIPEEYVGNAFHGDQVRIEYRNFSDHYSGSARTAEQTSASKNNYTQNKFLHGCLGSTNARKERIFLQILSYRLPLRLLFYSR